MLHLSIIGIALQGENSSPSLLLHPLGTDKVLFLSLAPSDAFSLSSALHGPIAGRDEPSRDLSARLLHALGGRLLAVELSGFGTSAVRAAAVVLSGADTLRLRCRPAEGAMLAIQCGAPLKVEDGALALAKDLEDPTLDLSPHVRTLVRTAMLRDKLDETPAGKGDFDFSRIPLVLENKINRDAPRPQPVARSAPKIQISFRKVEPAPAPAEEASTHEIPSHGIPVEEDRWATLLQVLAPETKTLM